MQLVATLIASPDRGGLTEDIADRVREAIAREGGVAGPTAWLDEGTACDLALDGVDILAARKSASRLASANAIDMVVQPVAERRRRLLIADMDATIVTGETLDELADQAGLKDRISGITARAMRGEIEFKAALRERVRMLAGLPLSALQKTLDGIEMTTGARTLVQTMRANGAYTVLVSGGFRFFTSRVAASVGFHEDQANDLVVRDGRLTGDVAEPILDKDAKLAALHHFAALRELPLQATLATGDGANDLPMIKAAGLGVAYHAKPVVEAEAPASIRYGDLTALLYLQGYRKSDFRT